VGESRRIEALVSVAGRYAGTLPVFEVDGPWWPSVENVTTRLDELLGGHCAVVRLAAVSDPVTGRGGTVRYHVEAESMPPNGALDRTPLDSWPDVIRSHPMRAPWAEPGGPRELVAWAAATATAAGLPATGAARQVKTWNLSCVYRLPTVAGPVWAKAVPSFMCLDADVIDTVRRYDESLAPAVLGIDRTGRRSLLAHAPGEDCFETDEPTIHEVVRRWVGVQARVATMPAGLRVIRPEDLITDLTRLLDRPDPPALTPAEFAEARQLVRDLPALIAELDEAGLPLTLVHGDFHPGNWRSDGIRRVIVDWADSYLGHPAADAVRLRDWLPPAQAEAAVTTWADAWRTHRPDSAPARALGPMSVLIHVLHALTYQRFLDNIEPDERVYHTDDPLTELQAALRCTRPGGW
jgi:hypothetical protein